MSELPKRFKSSFFCQRFAFPEDTMVHIAMNLPSPEVYNKLIKCCKYFWLKKPLITFNGLDHNSTDGLLRNPSKSSGINGFSQIPNFKIQNVNGKFWIYRKFSVIDHGNRFLASSIIPKIHRCDVSELTLENQKITFDDFKALTSSGIIKYFEIHNTSMKDKDGVRVPIEKMIELLPKLQELWYYNDQSITPGSAANLIAIPHFSKIKKLLMCVIPRFFKFEELLAAQKVENCNRLLFDFFKLRIC